MSWNQKKSDRDKSQRELLRDLSRQGKRRTKPPAVRVKSHLPGDYACAARRMFLTAATSAGELSPALVGPALAGRPVPEPCPDLSHAAPFVSWEV